ncbi:MAG: transcriptional repressor [Acholeplasmatales bacterium]|nr:transcriptional repressor [Acholeplasmatales bacterium]
MRTNQYNTKGKELINSAIKEFSNGFTIKELKDYLNKNNQTVGQTTIYRIIENLENKNIIKKYYDENNVAHYKYVKDCSSDNHFYLKCIKCSKIVHVDCNCINELSAHIHKQHKFLLDTKNIILEGLCSNCNKFF